MQRRSLAIELLDRHCHLFDQSVTIKATITKVSNGNGIPRAGVNELKLRHFAEDLVDPQDIR